MAPLPTLEPSLGAAARAPDNPKGLSGRRKEADDEGEDVAEPDKSKARQLIVITHFLQGDNDLHLALKIKLPAAYDDRTVREAIVQPFVEAYDKKHPEAPASRYQPFPMVKVLVWAGPTPKAADRFREKDRDGAELIAVGEKPIWGLLDTDEPVSVLRKRAFNRLKPTVEIELIKSESTALVLQTTPTTALLAPGEQLLAALTDVHSDLEDMHKIVDAAIAGGELAYLGVSQARDRNGRNALHLAATRGDATLCRKLLRRAEDVNAMDSNRDMVLHIAAMAGRQIIVSDLLELGALVHEKNSDLMSPLQLSVVDEAQGNGEVVRMLVQSGADIDAKCWDITPLMSAAAGGHYWATEVLLELGADVNIQNGYMMMAMDYARDQDTMELIYDMMRGFFLPDPAMVEKQKKAREQRKQASMGGMPGMPTEPQDKGPRLFQAQRRVPLPTAFDILELDGAWLKDFIERGEHYTEIRHAWRRTILKHHPDRQPKNQTDEDAAWHTAEFTKAHSAFEAIDSYYARNHAPPATLAAESSSTSPREPTGQQAGKGDDGTAERAAKAAVEEEISTPGAAREAADAKPKEGERSQNANAAQARAARPLLFKQRVMVHGLQAKPAFNGRIGVASQFDRTAGRYAVKLEGSGETLKVKEVNLKLAEETEPETLV